MFLELTLVLQDVLQKLSILAIWSNASIKNMLICNCLKMLRNLINWFSILSFFQYFKKGNWEIINWMRISIGIYFPKLFNFRCSSLPQLLLGLLSHLLASCFHWWFSYHLTWYVLTWFGTLELFKFLQFLNAIALTCSFRFVKVLLRRVPTIWFVRKFESCPICASKLWIEAELF